MDRQPCDCEIAESPDEVFRNVRVARNTSVLGVYTTERPWVTQAEMGGLLGVSQARCLGSAWLPVSRFKVHQIRTPKLRRFLAEKWPDDTFIRRRACKEQALSLS